MGYGRDRVSEWSRREIPGHFDSRPVGPSQLCQLSPVGNDLLSNSGPLLHRPRAQLVPGPLAGSVHRVCDALLRGTNRRRGRPHRPETIGVARFRIAGHLVAHRAGIACILAFPCSLRGPRTCGYVPVRSGRGVDLRNTEGAGSALADEPGPGCVLGVIAHSAESCRRCCRFWSCVR